MAAIATNAATIKAVAAQLAAWGWPSELWPGWSTRQNRQTPLVWESVTVHHTGAGPVSTSYMVNPVDRADLVVLCNAHITKDHQIRFLAAGGASHAGMSDRATYARMRAGKAPLAGDMKPGADSATFSANRLSFGIEVDNAGTSPEWDEWMLGATVALCAALHKVCGWPADPAPRAGTHKELTRRKPGDPIMDAGKLRTLVRAFLAAPYGPPGSKPWVLGDRLLSKDGNDEGPDVAELAALLTAKGYDVGSPVDVFGPAMDKAVRDVQVKAGFTGDDVDGVVGPKTLAVLTQEEPPVIVEPTPEPTPDPTPEPTPEPTPGVEITLTQLNAYAARFGGLPDRSTARVKFLKKLKASVYLLSEAPKAMRDFFRSEAGPNLLTYPVNYTGTVWDSKVFAHKGSKSVVFGTAKVHGAVRAELITPNGTPVDFISVFVRPSAVATAAQKQADIAKALTLVRKGVHTVIGGDWNTSSTTTKLKAAGLVRATPVKDTHDKAGNQYIDQVWVSKGIKVVSATLVDPGSISDHKFWKLRLLIPAKDTK